jgi:hypothetical protein
MLQSLSIVLVTCLCEMVSIIEKPKTYLLALPTKARIIVFRIIHYRV